MLSSHSQEGIITVNINVPFFAGGGEHTESDMSIESNRKSVRDKKITLRRHVLNDSISLVLIMFLSFHVRSDPWKKRLFFRVFLLSKPPVLPLEWENDLFWLPSSTNVMIACAQTMHKLYKASQEAKQKCNTMWLVDTNHNTGNSK